MTPEQRKRVAVLVTGEEVTLSNADGNELVYSTKQGYWHPSFTGADRQRSQALAVVEWLRDKLPIINVSGGFRVFEYESAFKSRDIDSLQRLVLELSDE